MEAIGYFRLQTETNRDETLPTLPEQEAAFFQFCETQGFQPVATFIDPESPGQNRHRGYSQLTEYLRQPGRGFAVVVLSRLEELAKDPREVLRRFLELEYLGARLVFTEGPQEAPLEQALALWRKRTNRNALSGRALDALKTKAMRGYGLGKTPFGYRIGSQGRLEVVTEEAQVVEQIYQWYVEEGLGLRLIARRLNDAATATRRGLRWSVVTVRDILRNRVYAGTYARFGVRVTGNHSPIIEQELFRRAQQKRGAASQERAPGRRTVFVLTGLAYCGYCQGRMIGVSRRQSWSRKRDGGRTETEYRYYRCGSRVNQSVCSYHTWRAEELEQAVLQAMSSDVASAPGAESETAPSEVRTALRARLRSLDKRFQRYGDEAAKGARTPEDLRALAQPILRESERLELRLQRLDASPDHRVAHETLWEQRRESVHDMLELWPQLSPLDRRVSLRELLDKVTVYDDHHVELKFGG